MVSAGVLAGAVLDQDGNPVINVDLRIKTPEGTWKDGPYLRYTTTDASGCFRVSGLYPREYEIDVNSPKLRYPVIGKAQVQAKTTGTVTLTFSMKNRK